MKEKPRSPIANPLVVLGGIAGILVGFLLGAILPSLKDLGSRSYQEVPFGFEVGEPISQGQDFGGIRELKSLSATDQEKFRQASRLVSEQKLLPALKIFAALKESNKNAFLIDGAIALVHIRFMDTSQADSLFAADALQSGRAQNPNHPWLYYLQGCFWEKTHRLDSAQAAFQKAIEIAPQFAYPYIRLGRLQMEKGEIGKARDNYHRAIGLMASSPENYVQGKKMAIPMTEVPPYDYLATLFYQTGSEDSALMALEYSQEKGWHTDQMDLVQGWLWEARGFLAKADSTYRRLVEKQPHNVEFAQALATLGWKPPSPKGTTRPTDAEAIFAVSLLDPLARQYPKNAPLWMALGQAYYRRGLFGLATECFDSSLQSDPSLPTLSEKRDVAYSALLRSSSKPLTAEEARRRSVRLNGPSMEDQAPVVIPGSVALLGTYGVSWGSSPTQVRQAYPKKQFQNLPGGNLMDTFFLEGLKHQYTLGFKDGKLWGIRVMITDSAGNTGDVFGRMIRTKVKISGDGKGTGEAVCSGFRTFQGVVWETDDTFEFMIQFEGKETEVRLIRLASEVMPQGKRLCDMAGFLKEECWK
jgi:tetratricopeptide (TPR) repeat protein